MGNNRCGPQKRSGDPLRMFLSRGDPPIIPIIGGGPPRGLLARGDPPDIWFQLFRINDKCLTNNILKIRFFRSGKSMLGSNGTEEIIDTE